MAKIKEDIFSGFSGKLGNVVGCKGKNGYYLRTRPEKYRDAKSKGQMQQRSKFMLANELLKNFTPLLRIGYRYCDGKRSGFTAAMSYVMANAICQGEEGTSIDYEKVKIAQGTLTTATEAKVELEKSKAIFTWKDNSGRGDAQPEDNVMTLVYNRMKGQAVYQLHSAQRSDGYCELPLPEEWQKEDLTVYIALENEERMCVSNSECLWNGVCTERNTD